MPVSKRMSSIWRMCCDQSHCAVLRFSPTPGAYRQRFAAGPGLKNRLLVPGAPTIVKSPLNDKACGYVLKLYAYDELSPTLAVAARSERFLSRGLLPVNS